MFWNIGGDIFCEPQIIYRIWWNYHHYFINILLVRNQDIGLINCMIGYIVGSWLTTIFYSQITILNVNIFCILSIEE